MKLLSLVGVKMVVYIFGIDIRVVFLRFVVIVIVVVVVVVAIIPDTHDVHNINRN